MNRRLRPLKFFNLNGSITTKNGLSANRQLFLQQGPSFQQTWEKNLFNLFLISKVVLGTFVCGIYYGITV